jgi:hypothetical protein
MLEVMMRPLENHIIALMRDVHLPLLLDSIFCDTDHCMNDHCNSFVIGKDVMQLLQRDINCEIIPVHIPTKNHILVLTKIVEVVLYHSTNCKSMKAQFITRKNDIFAAMKDVMPSF